ncbi:MAG: hypothetical protein MHM6MM_005810 [Cercozoa sp. M6MM]
MQRVRFAVRLESRLAQIRCAALGLDIGPTTACVAIKDSTAGNVRVAENAEGSRTTPAYVALSPEESFEQGEIIASFEDPKEFLVGEAARGQLQTNPLNTFHSMVRIVGRSLSDLEAEGLLKELQFGVVAHDDTLLLQGNVSLPVEVATAHIAHKMKVTASDYHDDESKVTLAVPVSFTAAQTEALSRAVEMSGMRVQGTLDSAHATVLAYGLCPEVGAEPLKVAIIDVGGTHTNVSVVNVFCEEEGVVLTELLSDVQAPLGGVHFRDALLTDLLEGLDTGGMPMDDHTLGRIREAAQHAVLELSSALKSEINLPFVAFNPATGQPVHLERTVKRTDLQRLTASLLSQSQTPLRNALADAGVEQVDEVLLAGGATRMPALKEAIGKTLNKTPLALQGDVRVDEVVAAGAAIHGIGVEERQKIVEEQAAEAKALPLSLGVALATGETAVLLHRQDAFPCQRSLLLSTCVDAQEQLQLRLVQGERADARANSEVTTVTVPLPHRYQRGTAQLSVTLAVDADGVLSLVVHDRCLQTEDENANAEIFRIDQIASALTNFSSVSVEKQIEQAEEMQELDRLELARRRQHIRAEAQLYSARILADQLEEYDTRVLDELETAIRTDDADFDALTLRLSEESKAIEKQVAAAAQQAEEEEEDMTVEEAIEAAKSGASSALTGAQKTAQKYAPVLSQWVRSVRDFLSDSMLDEEQLRKKKQQEQRQQQQKAEQQEEQQQKGEEQQELQHEKEHKEEQPDKIKPE